LKPTILGLRLPRVLAIAAAISAVVTFGLSLYRAPFSFQVNIGSSISGHAQVYYDIGKGIREEDSSIVTVHQGAGRYRLPLPSGTYRGLRFDPTDKGGNEIALSAPRIIDRAGRLVRKFPNQFAAIQEIDRMECGADLCRLKTGRGTDSILSLNLEAPFALVENPAIVWRQAARDFLACLVGIVAATLLTALLVRKVSPRIVEWTRAGWNWAIRRPRHAVLAVALCSTLLSCYPVIFFGKSFVSPNILGSGMLYPTPPFVPGYQDTDLEFSKGADTGAMLWQNLPYSVIQSRALKQDHELPLWNRYNSAGTPLLAQGLSMFGDPLHTIVLIANGAAWAWDVKFIVAKILFCLALGLFVLRSTSYLPSALILTGSSAFIGFFSFRFDHPAFFSMCYAPWLLLCWLEISRAQRPRAFAGWTLGLILSSWAELNSGGVKEGYMLLMSMHGAGVLVFLMTAPAGDRIRKLVYLSFVGIAFVLLSAPIWLPFLETLKNSWTAYDTTPAWQIQPGLILGFFDEIFYRAVNPEADAFNPSANFLILLGCLSSAAYFKLLSRDRTFVAILLASLPPLALVFGIVPPALVSRIPVLRNVGHLDNTFSCVLIIQAVVIAGFGFKYLSQKIGRRGWRSDCLVISFGFLFLCALYLGLTQARQRAPDQFDALGTHVTSGVFFYLYALSIACALFALPLLFRLLAQRPATTRVVVPLSLICFAAIHLRFGMHLKTEVAQIDDAVVNPAVRVDLQAPSPAIDWLKAKRGGFRTVGFGDTFFPGYNGISGLESVSGTDPLQNTYYRALLTSAQIPLLWEWRWVAKTEGFDLILPFYNLLNVRYFLKGIDSTEVRQPALSEVADLDVKVFENAQAWPRAFYVDRIARYDSTEQFVTMVRSKSGAPFAAIQESALPANGALSRMTGLPGSQRVVSARDYIFTNNTTTFTIDAPAAGIAVLTETFLPDDFVVTLNGSAASYFRINHAFKGVLVPQAGTYTISFSYWPRRFNLALLMAGCGALILTMWALALFRRKSAGSPSLFLGHESVR
jgi:hypothetical protein